MLEVTWSGGRLADAWYDTFELRLGMPNTPGKTLWFPTVQRCVKGVHRWIEIPQKGKAEPEEPAPGVTLVKSSRTRHGYEQPPSPSLVALVACPAAAGHGDGAARGFTSTVTSLQPQLAGLSVQVLAGDDELRVRNDTGRRIVIEGTRASLTSASRRMAASSETPARRRRT